MKNEPTSKKNSSDDPLMESISFMRVGQELSHSHKRALGSLHTPFPDADAASSMYLIDLIISACLIHKLDLPYTGVHDVSRPWKPRIVSTEALKIFWTILHVMSSG
jgi:hypothetical protein